MRAYWFCTVFAALAILIAQPHTSHACVTPPQNPQLGRVVTQFGKAPPGFVNLRLSSEVDIYSPMQDTDCVTGLGLGTTASRLPPSMFVRAASVNVYNTVTGQLTSITSLAFVPSDVTTQALAQGPVLFPDASWWGFLTHVQPFQPPQLAENEVFVLTFDVFVAEREYFYLVGEPAQVYGGEAFPDGTPNFDAGNYFASANPLTPGPISVGKGKTQTIWQEKGESHTYRITCTQGVLIVHRPGKPDITLKSWEGPSQDIEGDDIVVEGGGDYGGSGTFDRVQ